MTLSTGNRDVITTFQQGQYTIVKELYEEHYAPLLEFASQLINNKEEAHHIVQETFIRLMGMRDRFNTLTDIKAFLYITVRNICMAYIRSEKENEQGGDTAWYHQAMLAEVQFDEPATQEGILYQMHNQVLALPVPEQTVFRLLFYDRLTLQQAAEESGLTVMAVTQRRISAIRLLRNQLIVANIFSIPLFIYFVAVFCGEKGL